MLRNHQPWRATKVWGGGEGGGGEGGDGPCCGLCGSFSSALVCDAVMELTGFLIRVVKLDVRNTPTE